MEIQGSSRTQQYRPFYFLNGLFYRHFSPSFKNAIISTTIPYADLTGKPKTSTDNVFVLSIVEWDLSDRAHNGKGIDYYDLRATMGTKNVAGYKDGSLVRVVAKVSSITRTINRPKATSAGYNSDVFYISPEASLSTTEANNSMSVRPAINLNSNTKIKGPYKQKGGLHNGVTEDFVYYVLDFDQPQASTATKQ